MEQRTATIPFDLETAKKINIGEIAGEKENMIHSIKWVYHEHK